MFLTSDLTTLLPWLLASLSVVLLFVAGVLVWMRRSKKQTKAIPDEWSLTARPVFSSDERRAYRQLRDALPHHIVLAKLPLVRFCQPHNPQEVRYWYQLLGGIHVSFAICSANGRVLAAIDLEGERTGSTRRSTQIKQAVMHACRIRYIRAPIDQFPSVPEIQLLVPHAVAPTRGPHAARPSAATAGGRRSTLWQDSTFIQDSFFHTDPRDTTISDFGALRAAGELPPTTTPDPMERILRPHTSTRH